jgi:hypothetical protein
MRTTHRRCRSRASLAEADHTVAPPGRRRPARFWVAYVQALRYRLGLLMAAVRADGPQTLDDS